MQEAKLKGLTSQELDQLAINTIRTLSIDAVQQANSGHPGTPMALAPLVYVIWNEVMRYDPQDPIWPNRDRFVLSNGHASMLLWSVLFLTRTRAVNAQYERLGEPAVTLDDIRHFRQLGSKAPGHPEYHLVSGSRRRQVRSVKALPPASAWRSRENGLRAATTSRASTSSTTTSTPFAATAA
jgi:transketolase N-terminal domain/subunit